MTELDHQTLLQEQIAYYQARAGEYDEWFFRQGRYDRGAENNAHWFAEVQSVRQALDAFQPTGHVLEIACGTGLWTEQLAQHADHITALDAAPEVLAINQARVQSANVTYVQTDIFAWQPPQQRAQQYDAVFFSFWLSHVPPERFADFWHMVAAALKPGGRVFFVDSRYDLTSSAIDHHREGAAATTTVRRLNDGREFRIVKFFYQPAVLMAQLQSLNWRVEVQETERYFIYGQGGKI